jgi:hypothetical protein
MLYAQKSFGKWSYTRNGYFLTPNPNANGSNNDCEKFTGSLLFNIPSVWESRMYVFDINKDGDNEFIVSVVHLNGIGKIYAFNREGVSLPNFPFQIPQHSFPYINLYDDSILVASYVSLDNDSAYFLGINSICQQVIPEVRVGANMHFSRDPVIADITGDGKEEIIFLYANGIPGQSNSKLIFYNPRELNIVAELSLPYSQVTPAIGDIDGDGINDVIHETGIIFDTYILLWAFKGDGTTINGFPKNISNPTKLAGVHLADYLGDSRPEIILQLDDFPYDVIKLLSPEGEVLLYHSFYTYMWTGPPYTAFGKYSDNLYLFEPPFLNLIKSDCLYYIDLMNNTNEQIYLSLNPGGLTTFRTMASDTSDSRLFTVAVQSNIIYGHDSSIVFVINENKQIVQQINLNSTTDPTIFDVDNDGNLDVLYSYDNSFFIINDFYEYNPEKIEWPYEKHDYGRTSNYNYSDTTVPVELTSFTASVLQYEKSVQLNWTTATETNNFGFEILRGIYPANSGTQNDNEWNSIGFVPGFGTTTEPKSYSFVDENVTTGNYKYRLKQIDLDGTFEYSNEIEVEVDFTPKEFVLYQNYPNPFNPSTVISYQLPVTSNVTLKVYDILGNEIATLVNEEKQPGIYEVEFNLVSGIRNPASGVYFYKLIAGEFTQTRKMILLR